MRYQIRMHVGTIKTDENIVILKCCDQPIIHRDQLPITKSPEDIEFIEVDDWPLLVYDQ